MIDSDKDPQHISKSLAEAVHFQGDDARAKEVKKRDLLSEKRGLVEEIPNVERDAQETSDPNLSVAREQILSDAISANRDLENLETDDNSHNR